MPPATDLLLRRLEAYAGAAHAASPDAGVHVRFDQADLSSESLRFIAQQRDPLPAWWNPLTAHASFPGADLRGCSLRSARLGGLSGDRIDLTGADLASANLDGALLGGGKFDMALLEDADLSHAHLRFASLRDSVLECARLRGTDLRGAVLSGAQLDRADLRDAELEEADLRGASAREADFRGARFVLSDLRGVDFSGADFRDSLFRATKLDGANLRSANLEQVDLTGCSIVGIRLADAKLDRTAMHQSQIGSAVGEEISGDFELARRAYLNLELNFIALGDPDAASWIYRRRRRVQKLLSRQQVGVAVRARDWLGAAEQSRRYAIDKSVELVCDYGESVPRVLLTLVVLFVGFTILYGVSGAVSKDVVEGGVEMRRISRDPIDLLQYTLTAMLAPGGAPEGLHAASRVAQVIALLQSSLSIFLIGLLGFVAGNRIRR